MGKIINVCMISTQHSPFDSRVFHKEAKSLLRAGFGVTVIGKNNVEIDLISEGINVIGIERISFFKILKKLYKTARDIDADIYHCHEPESLLVLICLKLIKGKKVIYDVHEYYPDVIPLANLKIKFFLIFMMYIFEPLFCKCADAIIATDDEICKRYKKFNSNVYTVFNFPSKEIFKSTDIYNPELVMKYEKKSLLIYVGGMYKERGILELIKAVHKVSEVYPSIKLLLLGTFSTKEFEEECTEYINSNNLNDMIEFLGFIPHQDIPDYINASDIGIVLLKPIPKFLKNIPIKQFEYMACGKPVIGSRLPPIENFVGKEGAGILVDPNDIDEISEAIIYLLDHPKSRDEMGGRGKKAIERKYNWDRMENILIGIYSEIGD